MILKNIMINSADNNFRRCIVRGFSSIIKSLSAFVLSFIILTSSVFSQYLVASVSAAEVGAIVAVDLIVELAVTGGIVAGIMRGAQILQGEIESGQGFGSSGLDDYVNSVNQQIIDGVNDGSISNVQAGTVNKLSGVPVEIICPVYGIYQFLCTNELCNKIRMENPQTEEGVKQIVSAYWSSVNILDQRTFEEIASDPKNWVTNLDQLNGKGKVIVAQSVFEGYGEQISGPDSEFYDTGLAGVFHWTQSGITRDRDIKIAVSDIANYNDFVLLKYPDVTRQGANVFVSRLYVHSINQVDPYIYDPSPGNSGGTYAELSLNPSCTTRNGVRSITLSGEDASLLGLVNVTSPSIDLSVVFPNWGDIWGIEATDAIDLIDWCLGDSRFWNTDVIDLAVDEIADAVDAKVETGDDVGVVDVPLDLPIDIPIEGEDLAFPGTDTEEDFDDPPAYPGTDEWADVDETDWPTFDPDPEDPDPEDPDPEDPDNPSGGDPPELPPVNIPALLGLFPFCIPFDIKKAIEWFETDDGSDPVFYIPFDITISGRQIVDYDLEINLTNHGIRTVVIFLKSAQVVAYVIVLGYATSKVIY